MDGGHEARTDGRAAARSRNDRQSGGATHAFTMASAHPPGLAEAVSRLHDRLPLLLHQMLARWLPDACSLTLSEARFTQFGTWAMARTDASDGGAPQRHASYSQMRFAGLRGIGLIALPAGLLRQMIALYYGGKETGEWPDRPLSAAEERFAVRTAGLIGERLALCWDGVAVLGSQLVAHESEVMHISHIDSAAELLHLPVRISRAAAASAGKAPIKSPAKSPAKSPGEAASEWTIDILYPMAGLRLIDGLGAPMPARNSASAGDGPAAAWRGALAARLGDVRLSARCILARPQLSVAQLLALQPGDILPIPMPRALPLLIDGKRFATGTIGEQAGQAAFRIEAITAST